jgi:hypothetical protein
VVAFPGFFKYLREKTSPYTVDEEIWVISGYDVKTISTRISRLFSKLHHLPAHFYHSKFTWENLPPRMERKFAISERNDGVSVWI